MNRCWAAAPLGLAVLIAAGCGAAPPTAAPAASVSTSTTVTTTTQAAAPKPNFDLSNNLAMFADDGSQIKVGDPADSFRTKFLRPVKDARSLEPSDLPMDFASDAGWSVAGYEYENAARGVGAILYEDHVAVIMRQLENVQEQDVQTEVNKYQNAYSTPRMVQSDRVRYWFWESPPVRIMICAFKADNGTLNLTTAIGDDGAMDTLHISPDYAARDKDAIEHIFGRQGQSSNVSRPD